MAESSKKKVSKKYSDRIVIRDVKPLVEGGLFPVKRVVGDEVFVSADIFTNGHKELKARVLYRKDTDKDHDSSFMTPKVNDRWEGSFKITEKCDYFFTIESWIDDFSLWRSDMLKKCDLEVIEKGDISEGNTILSVASDNAGGSDRRKILFFREKIKKTEHPKDLVKIINDEKLISLMDKCGRKGHPARFKDEVRIAVERKKALFSAWYEFFPRSFGDKPFEHGAFKSSEKMLEYVSGMGFDVVYFPPIHSIGETARKGRNNATTAEGKDVGSPWAIGSKKGGHKAVHPGLGTLKDLRAFIKKARDLGLEFAMDLAFQCSRDHPYLEESPEWFKWREDGSIKFAENPPKKYEDIVPINFETEHPSALWEELKSVVFYWMDQGVKIFRVDNPHTKPFNFWRWLIAECKKKDTDVIFLAEAFTRPRVMEHLAKIGFSQSYTYFTWRNTKRELQEYLRELTQGGKREFMRPNFWPNTPDIFPEVLQNGGRPAFITRLVLAATLSSNYGIYGPAFELCESEAILGREEYLHSEKYEIKNWDLDRPGHIRRIIKRVNFIRKENAALKDTFNVLFCNIENDSLLCYCKSARGKNNTIFIAVNLDPYHVQSGWVELPLEEMGFDHRKPYRAIDLISKDKFDWSGRHNYIKLDPDIIPVHILKLEQ